jgi:N-acetylglucosaminyl-diphospho-decaprenol L-rhamnosyltransferase
MATVPDTLSAELQPLSQPRLAPRSRKEARPQGPRLTVVIVNYQQWEYTAALAGQLRASQAVRGGLAEIIIVDNDARPHPLASRLRRWPGVSLRRWGRNRGFARAVNEGGRLARGEWLLLLNPDMTVGHAFLDGVLELAERATVRKPHIGIVGFGLRNGDGSRQLSSGSFPTLASTLAGLLLPRWRRKYRTAPEERPSEVEWVTGCCLLVRRDCLDSLGGLDEDFFLYYEDVDLCRRARAAGWSVWYEPGQSAVHHHPLHSRSVPPALRLITRHSLLTYALKHWPPWQVRALAGIIRLESRLRQLRAWWRGDGRAAGFFRELRTITADLLAGRSACARRRLLRVARQGPLT